MVVAVLLLLLLCSLAGCMSPWPNFGAACWHPPPPALMAETGVKSSSASASVTATWEAEVIDMKALLTAIINGSAPLEAVKADMVFLNKQAKAFKKADVYPGVTFKEKKGIAVR